MLRCFAAATHARAVLDVDFPGAIGEICGVLAGLTLPITEIIGSGGGETRFTQRLRKSLTAMGWPKHVFEVAKVVDQVPRESTSHEVDHVRRFPGVGVIGCEIEWNNKDPFFDRDLENFKRLHAEGAISAGIVITRGQTLQDSIWDLVRRFAADRQIDSFEALAAAGINPTPKQLKNIQAQVSKRRDPVPFPDAWVNNFTANKFGAATTHWTKLMDRVKRGVGNPCPLLLIGLPATVVTFDAGAVEQLEDDAEAAAP